MANLQGPLLCVTLAAGILLAVISFEHIFDVRTIHSQNRTTKPTGENDAPSSPQFVAFKQLNRSIFDTVPNAYSVSLSDVSSIDAKDEDSCILKCAESADACFFWNYNSESQECQLLRDRMVREERQIWKTGSFEDFSTDGNEQHKESLTHICNLYGEDDGGISLEECLTKPGWVDIGPFKWSFKSLISDFPEFVNSFYDTAKQNPGGMQIEHSYAFYTILKTLRPPVVIENGVYKGFSTELIRETLGPDVKIFSFEPKIVDGLHKVDGVNYYLGRDFRDFASIKWDTLLTEDEIRDALILFDDHQDHKKRIDTMNKFGFKRAVYDDNVAHYCGDEFSLKQMFTPFCSGQDFQRMDNFRNGITSIKKKELFEICKEVAQQVKVYFEFPLIYHLNDFGRTTEIGCAGNHQNTAGYSVGGDKPNKFEWYRLFKEPLQTHAFSQINDGWLTDGLKALQTGIIMDYNFMYYLELY